MSGFRIGCSRGVLQTRRPASRVASSLDGNVIITARCSTRNCRKRFRDPRVFRDLCSIGVGRDASARVVHPPLDPRHQPGDDPLVAIPPPTKGRVVERRNAGAEFGPSTATLDSSSDAVRTGSAHRGTNDDPLPLPCMSRALQPRWIARRQKRDVREVPGDHGGPRTADPVGGYLLPEEWYGSRPIRPLTRQIANQPGLPGAGPL